MRKKAGKKGAAPAPEAHCHAEGMSCKSVVMEALYDFEEGSMPATDRAEFERHLQACPPCVRFLDSYRATGRTLRALKPRDIPPTLARTVFEFVKARCTRK
jgi:anti-sigma factor RsiW